MSQDEIDMHAPVAQLDRALDSDSKGRWFESSRAYHMNELRFSNIFFEKRSSSYPQSLDLSGLFLMIGGMHSKNP